MLLEFLSKDGIVDVLPGSFLEYFLSINFLHYALIMFLICAVMLVGISSRGDVEPFSGFEVLKFKASTGIMSRDLILTIVLAVCVLILWIVFSPWGIA